MSEKGKARATGGTVERAAGQACGAIPAFDSNTCDIRPQGAISRFLLFGRQNAVPLQQLVKLSGLDNRTARRLIEIERRTGTAICSNNQTGYYLAADAAELGRFVRSMQHRAGEIMKTAQALDETLQRESGQERMEGF